MPTNEATVPKEKVCLHILSSFDIQCGVELVTVTLEASETELTDRKSVV